MATSIIENVTESVMNSDFSKTTFSWTDYILFGTMLGLSALIGIYFGFCGKKQDTTTEYLLGGKTMKVFPVSMSLIASHISGLTLLAVPADVYRFGASYWLTCISIVLTCLASAYIFLPVYHKLQLTSTYEYLKLRFDGRTRTFTSFLFALSIFLYNPVVVYIPALAFSQATKVNVHLITPIVCSICIFYTTIGGLKAVVWSDTLQFTCTVGAALSVFFLGLASAGGFLNVWQESLEGGRLNLSDFSLDPTKRDTFWAVLIGQTSSWLSIVAVSQGCVQRFLAVPTISDAKKTIVIFGFGMCVIKSISVITGLIMYTRYHDCDPLTTKDVERPDQLLPYYVMDVAHKIPGLSGLFIAGIFSAGLSTLSATLNTVAGTIYEDFIAPWMPEKTTEKQASNIIKVIVIISGVICTALVFIFEHLGGLLPLTIAIVGTTSGPLLGLFVLGMLVPIANTKGALWGSVLSLLATLFIGAVAQYYKFVGRIKEIPLSLSVNSCDFAINATISNVTSVIPPSSPPLALFRLSHYYYTFIGLVMTVIFGVIISLITRTADEPPVDRRLISPVAYAFLPKEKNCKITAEYNTVEKALEMVTYSKSESR